MWIVGAWVVRCWGESTAALRRPCPHQALHKGFRGVPRNAFTFGKHPGSYNGNIAMAPMKNLVGQSRDCYICRHVFFSTYSFRMRSPLRPSTLNSVFASSRQPSWPRDTKSLGGLVSSHSVLTKSVQKFVQMTLHKPRYVQMFFSRRADDSTWSQKFGGLSVRNCRRTCGSWVLMGEVVLHMVSMVHTDHPSSRDGRSWIKTQPRCSTSPRDSLDQKKQLHIWIAIIYIYTHIHTCMCVYVYIYIYIYTIMFICSSERGYPKLHWLLIMFL